MKIQKAFDSGLIPASYVGVIPLKCHCGEELEVNDTLTKMWCPSERCDWKQVARMNKMLTAFGVKDIGESYCVELWREMKNVGLDDSHVNVFRLTYPDYPDRFSDEVTLKKFNNIQKVITDSLFDTGYTFGELVSKLSLPNFDINARNLLIGFNCLEDMILYVKSMYPGEYSLYTFVRERFGYGVQSRKIYNTLYTFQKDIKIAEEIFGLRLSVRKQIRVAITGRIECAGRFTRKEFVKHCNDMCSGYAEIVDSSASSSVQWVIADESSDSSKYNYGVRNGILINSSEFENWLKEEVII